MTASVPRGKGSRGKVLAIPVEHVRLGGASLGSLWNRMWLAIDVTLTVDRHVSSLSNPKGGKRSPIIENDTHDVPILQTLETRQQIGNEHRCVTFRPTQKLRLAQNIETSA